MGPIATKAQLEKVAGFVERARAEGGEVVAGGRPRRGAGARGRLLLAADDRRRRRARLVPRAERGLRAGARAVSVQLRGRGACGRPTAPATASPPACGPATSAARTASRARLEAGTVWVNMYRAMAPQSPFGGLQGERHRATERDRRDPRVRPDQERLGRALRRGPGPVRAASASAMAHRRHPPRAADHDPGRRQARATCRAASRRRARRTTARSRSPACSSATRSRRRR